MGFNEAFDKMRVVRSIPMRGQIIELLQRTWAAVAPTVCENSVRRKRPFEVVNGSDIARVELFPDEARCAAYSHMNRWQGTDFAHILSEWFDLELGVQNALLIEAFPDGEVYGV